jgi:glutamyl-tRNA reductase
MHIVVVGLSHRTAPVEVREKLSIPDQSITESLKALKAFSDVLEVSILSTCKIRKKKKITEKVLKKNKKIMKKTI